MFAIYPEYVCRRNFNFTYQVFGGHSVVALAVCRWYTSLVYPEEKKSVPRCNVIVLFCPDVEHECRCIAAAEGDCELPILIFICPHQNSLYQSMSSVSGSIEYFFYHSSQYKSVFVRFLHGLVHSAPWSFIIASLSNGPQVPAG